MGENKNNNTQKIEEEQLGEVAGGTNSSNCQFSDTWPGGPEFKTTDEDGVRKFWRKCKPWPAGACNGCPCRNVWCFGEWHLMHGTTKALWPNDVFNHRRIELMR